MKKKQAILLGIAIAVLLSGTIYKMKQSASSNKELKISLAGAFEDQVTPENISTIALYQININLWDTLVTSDRSPAIARITGISSDHLSYNFEITEFAKFSNGRKITADDVKFSIERTIAKEENGHANARGMIKKINVKSPSELTLTLNAATPSFLFLLSTPEFAVIPREICDEKTLKIVTLETTSGAYVVKNIDKEQKLFHLIKNPNFERHINGSPDAIEVSFDTSNIGSADPINAGNKQFYEIYNSSAGKIVKNLNEQKNKFSYSVTKPSLSVFLNRNTKKISPERAAAFSGLVKKYFSYETETEKKSFQFLPSRTFGSLNSEELPQLDSSIKIEEITIKASNPNAPVMLALKEIENKAHIKLNIVDMKNPAEADFILDSQGMNADYPEVELYLSLLSPYAFIPPPPEAKALIMEAFHESDSHKRSQLIKRISTMLLGSGSIIPLTVRSYLHVFNSENVDASGTQSYDGDIPFWKIRML